MINGEVIHVDAITGRASQGITRPFRCRGNDQNQYYAKGRGAGRKSLVAEWIAGCLAMEFGLPIAPFRVLDVPQILIDVAPAEFNELGAGYVFGSCALQNVLEMSWGNIKHVPIETRQDILIFDLWVKNEDRHLTEKGGNPNLLWSPTVNQLSVIDHNQAFDEGFDRSAFATTHIFSRDWNATFGDWVLIDQYKSRLAKAYRCFDDICDRMPDDWWWVGEGVPLSFTREQAKAMLAEFQDEQFWRIAS